MLRGCRIALTRPREQAAALAGQLESWGARVLSYPLIRIAPTTDPAPLQAAAVTVADYDWVVFTSANAVRSFLAEMPVDIDTIRSRRIAAVGQATAAALERAGVPVHAVPESSSGSAVAGAMAAQQQLMGLRVLWPRAANAHPELKTALAAAGAHVQDVEAYAAQPIPENARKLHEALEAGMIDVLTFTSPSAIDCFTATGSSVPGHVHVAVIGPVTAGAARNAGIRVEIESPNAAAEDMAYAILRWFRASAKDTRDV